MTDIIYGTFINGVKKGPGFCEAVDDPALVCDYMHARGMAHEDIEAVYEAEQLLNIAFISLKHKFPKAQLLPGQVFEWRGILERSIRHKMAKTRDELRQLESDLGVA